MDNLRNAVHPKMYAYNLCLTHLPLELLICVSESGQHWYGSENGLLPIRRQAIISTNTVLLSIRPLGTNFSENLIIMKNFSFTKMHLKTSSAKWRSFCPGGYELIMSSCGLILSHLIHILHCDTMVKKIDKII